MLTAEELNFANRLIAYFQERGIVQPRAREVELYGDGPHKFSSTHFEITGDLANIVRGFASSIPAGELTEEGREDDPHITIKYGLHTSNPSDVARVVRGTGTISVTLGPVSLFEADEHDVVKVEVLSPDLHRLNKVISESLDFTDKYLEYRPHLTLAYVRKGEGAKYAGMNPFDGQRATFDRLIFSDQEGNKSVVPLTSKEVMPVVTYALKEEDGGRWVTIGAQQGGDGEKHGGTPCYIKDGKIVKGPAALHGRSVAQLKGKKKQERDEQGREAMARHGEVTKRLDAIHGALADRRDPTAMESATGIEREPGVGRASETERMGIHQPAESSGTPSAQNPEPELPPDVADFLKKQGLTAVPTTKQSGQMAQGIRDLQAKLSGMPVDRLRMEMSALFKSASKEDMAAAATELGYNVKGDSKAKVEQMLREHLERQLISSVRGAQIPSKPAEATPGSALWRPGMAEPPVNPHRAQSDYSDDSEAA